jgi:hypothetical protein
VVYHTEALIIGGCLAEAMTVAERCRQRCAGVPGVAQAFAAAVSGMAAFPPEPMAALTISVFPTPKHWLAR